jgi:succinate-semialdehyde dehydrogenase/glutarate-semialdehyde dehydrogenase
MNYPDIQLRINGRWQSGTGNTLVQVHNPATDELLGEFFQASASDIDATLSAAQQGLQVWSKVSPVQRADILHRAANLLRERARDIAHIAALDEGQPIEEAITYVQRGADMVEWDAAEGRRVYGRIIPSGDNTQVLATREPIGVVAAFTPWNGPTFTPCRKIGSALAAGCSIIVKGAEEAPASTMAVVQAFIDAGVPDGVINLLYGNPQQISQQLIASPIVRMVSFTGSVAVGKLLAQQAAAHMKPCLMELGGHAPVIVCADADVEGAAKKLAFVKYRNAGQACLCPSRFWIDSTVYEQFSAVFLAEVEKIKVGGAFDKGVSMGPVATHKRLEAIQYLVKDGLASGAKLVAGGKRIGKLGCFFEPTVFAHVPEHAKMLSEEPFGPLTILNAFTDIDAVISAANNLPYGLAAYLFTRSAAMANKLSSEIACGAIGINHLVVSTSGVPFGGLKDSGYGREGGIEGVQSYTVTKTVSQMFV